LMGWTSKVDLETGLRRTIEWFERNLGRYKADLYNV
jgi:dTDP-D-glucose 4,6-dehydratase